MATPSWQALEYWEYEAPPEADGTMLTCMAVPLRRLAPSEWMLPRAVHDYWRPGGGTPTAMQALTRQHRALFFAMIGVL
jgi:hypothetical protein